MEFSIWCPTDGAVTVGLKDVESIVVKSGSDVQVMFACPVCGATISLCARIPHALLASLDDSWVKIEGDGERSLTMRRADCIEPGEDAVSAPAAPAPAPHRDIVESYCEYFRRELETVRTVEELLAEIDRG